MKKEMERILGMSTLYTYQIPKKKQKKIRRYFDAAKGG
jgi:hypothetical protein